MKVKVIILEDNKLISKILANKLNSSIEIDVHIAHSLAGAKALVEKNSYLFGITDLHLPDSNPDEIIDFFINQKNIPVIAMTSSEDKKLRKQIWQNKLIDYVIKSRSESIDYIVHLSNRIIKNKDHIALVVDDSKIYQKEISNTLNRQLINTIVADDGAKAMDIIRHNSDITLVITDYEMPNVNGLELVLALRRSYKKYDLPIIGVSTQKDNSIEFLKYGVNDFIRKPFFKEELQTRVNNTLDAIENVRKLNDFANTDFLTGVANRKFFYSSAKEYFIKSKVSKESFAVAMLDIDHFKNINDTYGHDIGDEVIRTLAKTIKDNIKGQDIVARFGGEEFCVLLKNIEVAAAYRFFESLREKIASSMISINGEEAFGFTVSIGVTSTRETTIEEMIKQSDISLYEAKNNGRNRVCSQKVCKINLECEAV